MAQIESMLVQGMESNKSIDLLLTLTKIKSESAIDAIKAHFVDGEAVQMAAEKNGTTKGNLSRDLKKLNVIAVTINSFFEENYHKMIPVKKGDE